MERGRRFDQLVPRAGILWSDRRRALLAGVGLLVCTGGPSNFIAQHLVTPHGDWRSWMYVYPFAAVAAGGAYGAWTRLRAMPVRTWPWPVFAVAAYTGWVALSATWSVAPAVTPLDATTGLGIAAFGIWFGLALRFDEHVEAVVIATGLACIASLVVIELRPRYGKMYLDIGWAEQDAPWQGIFGNRNSLAPVCVLGLIALVGFVMVRPTIVRTVLSVGVAAIEVLLLAESGGLTATLALAAMAVTAVALPGLWWIGRRGVPGAAVGTVAAIGAGSSWWIAFAVLDRVAPHLGRDSTLTGRRFIWADVRSFIRERPWFGYGFGAFWERSDLTAATYAKLGPYASAHDSALEVLLGCGYIGLVLFLAVACAGAVAPFSWTWRRRSTASWWWCVVVVFVVTQNLMESFVLWHSYIWVLFVAAALAPFGDSAAPSVPEEPHEAASAADTPGAIAVVGR